MPKHTRVKKSVGGVVLAGMLATMLGCSPSDAPPKSSGLSNKHNPPRQTEQYEIRLQKVVESYNSGDIKEKDRIINELYDAIPNTS